MEWKEVLFSLMVNAERENRIEAGFWLRVIGNWVHSYNGGRMKESMRLAARSFGICLNEHEGMRHRENAKTCAFHDPSCSDQRAASIFHHDR